MKTSWIPVAPESGNRCPYKKWSGQTGRQTHRAQVHVETKAGTGVIILLKDELRRIKTSESLNKNLSKLGSVKPGGLRSALSTGAREESYTEMWKQRKETTGLATA